MFNLPTGPDYYDSTIPETWIAGWDFDPNPNCETGHREYFEYRDDARLWMVKQLLWEIFDDPASAGNADPMFQVANYLKHEWVGLNFEVKSGNTRYYIRRV